MTHFEPGDRIVASNHVGLSLPRYFEATVIERNVPYLLVKPVGSDDEQRVHILSATKIEHDKPLLIHGADVILPGESSRWEPTFETLDYTAEEFAGNPRLAERLFAQMEKRIASQEQTIEHYHDAAARAQEQARIAERWLESMQHDLELLRVIAGYDDDPVPSYETSQPGDVAARDSL